MFTKPIFAHFSLMRSSLPVALMFCSIMASAQYFTIDTIKGESPYNKEVSFIFPQLKNAANQSAADIINKELVKEVLNIESGKQQTSIFENIWGKKEMDIPNVGDISFRVINNDAAFISMSITATACYADCEEGTRYYTRESATGNKLNLEDIFSPEGIRLIADSVRLLKAKRIQEQTAKLKSAIDQKILSEDDNRDYRTAIDIYTACAQNGVPPGHLTYALSTEQMMIALNNCLPYAIHFIDKVDYTFTFNVGSFREYMTDYGKKLLP